MKAVALLQEVIKQEFPDYKSMSIEQRDVVVRQVLSTYMTQIIKKIKLPKLTDIQFKAKREEFLNKRRRKGFEKKTHDINFPLWKLLYDAKRALPEDVAQNTKLTMIQSEATPSRLNFDKPENSNFLWSFRDTSSSNNTINQVGSEITQLKIESTLETKTISVQHYQKFISSLDRACRSNEVQALGFAEFYLIEKSDIEIPSWNKLILNVKFYHGTLEKKIAKWESLRDIIDTFLKKIPSDADKNLIEDLNKRFYIKLIH